MALKLTLRPGEKFIINGAVIQNGDRRCNLVIQNQASLLRERDIMRIEEAATPMRRIYFAIMMMYLDTKGEKQFYEEFVLRMTQFMNAVSSPEAVQKCVAIIQFVHDKQYYKALTAAKSLYAFEEKRLNYVAPELSAGPAAG